MRYDKLKILVASVSILCVFLTVGSALSINLFATSTELFAVTMALISLVAAITSILSLALSRKLTKERKANRVFLIYAREDIDAARNLKIELKKHGFNAWLDIDEINPGQMWQKAILHALEESAVAIVLISKNFSNKGFIQKELNIAFDTLQNPVKDMSPVLPVRLDESNLPESLSGIYAINLNDIEDMNRLLTSLNKMVPRDGRSLINQ